MKWVGGDLYWGPVLRWNVILGGTCKLGGMWLGGGNPRPLLPHKLKKSKVSTAKYLSNSPNLKRVKQVFMKWEAFRTESDLTMKLTVQWGNQLGSQTNQMCVEKVYTQIKFDHAIRITNCVAKRPGGTFWCYNYWYDVFE